MARQERRPDLQGRADGTVDWYTYSGFRRYHSECHVCHGPNGEGSSYAPALANSLKTIDYADFYGIVVSGRKDLINGKDNVMPTFAENKNVMCYLNDIYVYLRARSQDAIPRGRPAEARAQAGRVRRGGNKCMGELMRMTSGDKVDAVATLALVGVAPFAAPAARARTPTDGAIELVDPHVFRACADPRDLPFSNEAGEGFENKIADLFAKKLGKSVAYTFYPGATGFVRNTLNAHRCDVVLGIAQGDDIVQPTNPYYRTGYVAGVQKGRAARRPRFASGSAAEDGADRRHCGHARRSPISPTNGLLAADQVLRADGRYAFRFADARDDGGSREGRHRRRSALGSARRLLRRARRDVPLRSRRS